jgi:hypothetical protein
MFDNIVLLQHSRNEAWGFPAFDWEFTVYSAAFPLASNHLRKNHLRKNNSQNLCVYKRKMNSFNSHQLDGCGMSLQYYQFQFHRLLSSVEIYFKSFDEYIVWQKPSLLLPTRIQDSSISQIPYINNLFLKTLTYRVRHATKQVLR